MKCRHAHLQAHQYYPLGNWGRWLGWADLQNHGVVQPALLSIVGKASRSLEEGVFRRVTGSVMVLKALALNLFTLQNYFVKIIHLQPVGEFAQSERIAVEFYGVISDLYCCQWQVKWAQHSTDWCSGVCISWVRCFAFHVQKCSWCTQPVNNHVCKILMNIQWNSLNWCCCLYTAIWIHGKDETLADVSGSLPHPGCLALYWRSLCGPHIHSSWSC